MEINENHKGGPLRMYENRLKSMKIIRGAPCKMYENQRKAIKILRGAPLQNVWKSIGTHEDLKGDPSNV